MQYNLDHKHRSEEESIKDQGLILDFDEIARKGAMSKEEKLIGKWYGIYASRQAGAHMARVVIPGGSLSTSRARNVADVAQKYGQGNINLTTRQAMQFHWLQVPQFPQILRLLAEEGNSTFHGCGDVTRTIVACPLAENCSHARINVRPIAERTMNVLTDDRSLDNLPRKFKISFSGCLGACAQPYMNCVGNIAILADTLLGFKVVIGGGMGWMAFVAQELFSFVPQDIIVDVNHAIGILFREHGDRYNRQKSRLKFVVQRLGIGECRKIVLENLTKANVDTKNLRWDSLLDTGTPVPERPLAEENPVGTDGFATVRARVPMGELTHNQLRGLAEIADVYGDQKIYTSNRQNIEIRGVAPAQIVATRNAIEALGFPTNGFYGLRDIIPCVGTTYCPKAVGTTRNLHNKLQSLLKSSEYADIEKYAIINITGCPNSCVPYRISDIGFRGMRIREEAEGSSVGYEMLLGGDQTAHGQKIGEFKEDDCVTIVATVLSTFRTLKNANETLRACVVRVGIDTFKKAILL